MKKENTLSAREIQVLKLVCKEKKNIQIAKLLKINVKTVEFHRSNLYKKTKAKNIIGLFKYALKNGLANV